MPPNPALGVFLHAVGGFAAGSFYAPLKKVRRWSWETMWLMMGIAAWLIAPRVAARLTTPQLGTVLAESLSTAPKAVLWAALFGGLWGIGNLTFGMAVRYLGMALGYAMALGFCMVFGALVPPIFAGTSDELIHSQSGQTILGGIFLCVVGIAVGGIAGAFRERELGSATDAETGEKFSFGKGLAVAVVAGLLSACFAFGLAAGKPMADISASNGTNPLYANNVVLIAVLMGGFLSNAASCLMLNSRNKSFGDYVDFDGRYLANCLFAWIAGITWFFQFFFYGMGQTKLGRQYEFSSWSIHMAFIVVFSTLWGIAFHEWRGTSGRTRFLVWLGILILIVSTVVIGYGNKLAAPVSAP